jgi:hypothetical protein
MAFFCGTLAMRICQTQNSPSQRAAWLTKMPYEVLKNAAGTTKVK